MLFLKRSAGWLLSVVAVAAVAFALWQLWSTEIVLVGGISDPVAVVVFFGGLVYLLFQRVINAALGASVPAKIWNTLLSLVPFAIVVLALLAPYTGLELGLTTGDEVMLALYIAAVLGFDLLSDIFTAFTKRQLEQAPARPRTA